MIEGIFPNLWFLLLAVAWICLFWSSYLTLGRKANKHISLKKQAQDQCDHRFTSFTFNQNSWYQDEVKRQENYFVPVEIVEEWQEVESQFAPAFFLTERQDVSVHDGCWVVESWTAHHRSAHVPATQEIQQCVNSDYTDSMVLNYIDGLTLMRQMHTSRHDKPAAASWDRGWATRPHRRTSRRRRSGWDTLGAPAEKRNIWIKCQNHSEKSNQLPCYLL